MRGAISTTWGDFQPSENVRRPTQDKTQSVVNEVSGKEEKRMEPTTHIFLTVKVKEEEEEEEEEATVKMEIVEAGNKIIEKIESVSAWVKTEVGLSEDGALFAIKADQIDVKEEVVEQYKEFVNCSDFEVKEELVDLNNAEEEDKGRDVDDKEDEEPSSDEEQIDARQLYPRRAAEETSEEEDGEEVPEKFEKAVVKSIEIMEASCFGQMDEEEEERKDGKDKRLDCKKCSRQFSSRRWLAR